MSGFRRLGSPYNSPPIRGGFPYPSERGSPDRKTFSPSGHLSIFPSFPESTRTYQRYWTLTNPRVEWMLKKPWGKSGSESTILTYEISFTTRVRRFGLSRGTTTPPPFSVHTVTEKIPSLVSFFFYRSEAYKIKEFSQINNKLLSFLACCECLIHPLGSNKLFSSSSKKILQIVDDFLLAILIRTRESKSNS